jgi:hypothetical protein
MSCLTLKLLLFFTIVGYLLNSCTVNFELNRVVYLFVRRQTNTHRNRIIIRSSIMKFMKVCSYISLAVQPVQYYLLSISLKSIALCPSLSHVCCIDLFPCPHDFYARRAFLCPSVVLVCFHLYCFQKFIF